MMEKVDNEEGEPTLMPNLSRLLVSHYLREHPHRVVLIKLYRPFVSELVDKARQAGLGCCDVASFYDSHAMMELVDKFGNVYPLSLMGIEKIGSNPGGLDVGIAYEIFPLVPALALDRPHGEVGLLLGHLCHGQQQHLELAEQAHRQEPGGQALTSGVDPARNPFRFPRCSTLRANLPQLHLGLDYKRAQRLGG